MLPVRIRCAVSDRDHLADFGGLVDLALMNQKMLGRQLESRRRQRTALPRPPRPAKSDEVELPQGLTDSMVNFAGTAIALFATPWKAVTATFGLPTHLLVPGR